MTNSFFQALLPMHLFIHVHISDETILTFKQVSSGLFLLEDNIDDLVSNNSFLQLVSTNKYNCSKQELTKAVKACKNMERKLGAIEFYLKEIFTNRKDTKDVCAPLEKITKMVSFVISVYFT